MMTHHELLQGVQLVLQQTDASGVPLHDDDDVATVVPLLWLMAGDTRASLLGDPFILAHVQNFVAAVGLRPGMDAERVREMVDAYLVSHPPSTTFFTALTAVVADLAARGAAIDARVLDSIGVRGSVRPVGGAAPPGSVKASPLLRFQRSSLGFSQANPTVD